MGKLENIIQSLDSVREGDIDKELLKLIDSNKAAALDMNTGQLFSGRDSKGATLSSYKSQSYAEFKSGLNPTPGLGNPDLKLTGAFYRGFFIDTDNFPVKFSSNDSKSEALSDKYGQDIFGIDSGNLEEFRQEIKPDVQALFRSLLRI